MTNGTINKALLSCAVLAAYTGSNRHNLSSNSSICCSGKYLVSDQEVLRHILVIIKLRILQYFTLVTMSLGGSFHIQVSQKKALSRKKNHTKIVKHNQNPSFFSPMYVLAIVIFIYLRS